jgi:hypothetical protein
MQRQFATTKLVSKAKFGAALSISLIWSDPHHTPGESPPTLDGAPHPGGRD